MQSSQDGLSQPLPQSECSSYFGQNVPEQTIRWMKGREIRICGKTDLHNYYAEPNRKESRGKAPPKQYGGKMYSTARSRQTAVCVGKVHADIARSMPAAAVYLVTLTHADDWTDVQRRRALRTFLDRVRKEAPYRGHLWAAERHKSGKLHHHIALRMARRWNYQGHITRWSLRYCGSVNGLDIKGGTSKGERMNAYACKAIGYTCKKVGEPDKLPFRWWGTSRVVRKVRVAQDKIPYLWTVNSLWKRNQCARVPDAMAISWCAWMTWAKELRSRERAKRTLVARWTKRRRNKNHVLSDGGICNAGAAVFARLRE